MGMGGVLARVLAPSLTAFWTVFLAAVLATPALAQPILVAQIGPFTGLPSPDAKEVNAGARAWFQRVNANGGVRGRRVELFELDDQFKPDVFVQQFGAAMLRKPVALLSPIGSAAMTRLIQDSLLDRHSVVVINAIPGSEPFRKPGHARLFHVRAGDRQQIEKIIQTAHTLGLSRLGVLYQDLPMGAAGIKVAHEVGSRPGVKVALDGVQAKHDEVALAGAARQIAAGNPEGALVIGSPRFMADAVAALRKAGMSQFVFALSYLPAPLVAKVAGEQGARGVAIAQTFPNPHGVALAVQRDFQAAMRAAYPDLAALTAFHFEGYLSARLLTEGMTRAAELEGDSIARAIKALGPLDFGGFRLVYSASNEGSSFVDIGIVSTDGRLRY